MNIVELLVNAANKNHGRTLQPEQVREVVAHFQALSNELTAVTGRLDGLTRITTVLIGRLGGEARMEPFEFDEADEIGFHLRWDEEGDYIEVRLDDVAVPEVQDEDEATDGEPDFYQPPLPFDGPGSGEEEEGSTEEAAE